MKKILCIICPVLFLNICLSAQEHKITTVKAGTRILDYFPVNVRYRYLDFTDGSLVFKNGKTSSARFNYNFLLGEMEFIQSHDTLSIVNKKDISFITVAMDTFFYNNGYIELIFGGPVRVGFMKNIKLKDIQRKGAYGVTDRNSSIDTYNSVSASGRFYELIPDEDWVFQETQEYYFSTPGIAFIQFTKKNVLKTFPQKEIAIKEYLKSNRINFNSRDDLFRFAGYLSDLAVHKDNQSP